VLRGILGEPGCALRALARTLGVDPMNVKRWVDELERRGLVQSGQRPGDRRPRTLTGAGRTLAAEVGRLVIAQPARLTGPLSPDERTGIELGLARLESQVGIGAGPLAQAGSRSLPPAPRSQPGPPPSIRRAGRFQAREGRA